VTHSVLFILLSTEHGNHGWQVSAIRGLNQSKPCWQKRFLPKHIKCSSIIDKLTHFLQKRLKRDTIY